MTQPPDYVPVKIVAQLTGVSASHLNKLRLYRPDESPPWVRLGTAVRYPLHGPNGLHAWMARRIVGTGAAA